MTYKKASIYETKDGEILLFFSGACWRIDEPQKRNGLDDLERVTGEEFENLGFIRCPDGSNAISPDELIARIEHDGMIHLWTFKMGDVGRSYFGLPA